MQGSPLVQGAGIGDVLDTTPVWDEALVGHLLFKLVGIELGKTPLFGDVDLLTPGELELGPA